MPQGKDMKTNDNAHEVSPARMRLVVTASSAGTTFEWYDFFLGVPLAGLIAKLFFAGLGDTMGYLFALLSFAAGFAFRPLGALIFGRMGDRLGRKATFLITTSLMGGATLAIGLLPTVASVGLLAPVLFVFLRILQGMALGGEWGGAAIYIAEHARHSKRGYLTSFIGPAASIGLGAAMLVTLAVRTLTGEEAFAVWGWRIPFLLSGFLLAASLWIRLKLHESPVFESLRKGNTRSTSPVRESFGQWRHLKLAVLALFSMMIAQGAIWFTTFFYSQSFLERILKVPPRETDLILLTALVASIPLYVFFGKLSDHIGRKPVMLFGIVLAAVAIFPVFSGLREAAHPVLAHAVATQPVVVEADAAGCTTQFDPVAAAKAVTQCDRVREVLAKRGVPYQLAAPAPGNTDIRVMVGTTATAVAATTAPEALKAQMTAALANGGYPESAKPQDIDFPRAIGLLLILVVAATALYGPQAACLVELFPAHIRYTALSLPYHIGTGWVGGFLPATAYALTLANGDSLFGLWYPVTFATVAAVVMLLFLPETRHRSIH